jgi:hypothetical protein
MKENFTEKRAEIRKKLSCIPDPGDKKVPDPQHCLKA